MAGPDGIFASVRSDCAKEPARSCQYDHKCKTPLSRVQQDFWGAQGPSRTTANPPLSYPARNLKSRTYRTNEGLCRASGHISRPRQCRPFRARMGASYGPVVITVPTSGNRPFYRVCVGHESSEGAARELAEKLRSANLAAGDYCRQGELRICYEITVPKGGLPLLPDHRPQGPRPNHPSGPTCRDDPGPVLRESHSAVESELAARIKPHHTLRRLCAGA